MSFDRINIKTHEILKWENDKDSYNNSWVKNEGLIKYRECISAKIEGKSAMKLYTSYFSNIKKLPDNVVPIAICGKSPDGYKGLRYKKVAPSWSIWKEYHDFKDIEKYAVRFQNEILSKLAPKTVLQDLLALSNSQPFALICYEKRGDFCHRHLVAKWLQESGLDIEEFLN